MPAANWGRAATTLLTPAASPGSGEEDHKGLQTHDAYARAAMGNQSQASEQASQDRPDARVNWSQDHQPDPDEDNAGNGCLQARFQMELAGPPFSAVLESALPLGNDGLSEPLKWACLKDQVLFAAGAAYPQDDPCSRALRKCPFLKTVCTKLNLLDAENRRADFSQQVKNDLDEECRKMCVSFVTGLESDPSMDAFDPNLLPGRPKKRRLADDDGNNAKRHAHGEAHHIGLEPEESDAIAAVERIVAKHGAIINFEAAAVFKRRFPKAVPQERRKGSIGNKDLAWATGLLQRSSLSALKFGWWGLRGQCIGSKKDIQDRKAAAKNRLPDHLREP